MRVRFSLKKTSGGCHDSSDPKVQRAEIPVMVLAVRDRSDEIGQGWDHVESVRGSLRGRRFVHP